MSEANPEGERVAIVAWLRAEAEEYRAAGSYGRVSYAVLRQAADAIERGAHLNSEAPHE